MQWIDKDGLTVLQFPALAALPGIRHAIFMRRARNGPDHSADLNLGLKCGSPDWKVWENRRRVRSYFGKGTMVFAHQVHGSRVAVWDGNGADRRLPEEGAIYLAGDALATGLKDQLLFIQTADCQAVIIADPERRIVANIHSGWRGSIQNIAARTVMELERRFGCRAADLRCGIGPSLGPCCAEFINYRQEIPPPFWAYGDRRSHFDFWRLTVDQLTGAGVQPSHISTSGICTRCNNHLFFSYRADRQTGRFAAVVMLEGE